MLKASSFLHFRCPASDLRLQRVSLLVSRLRNEAGSQIRKLKARYQTNKSLLRLQTAARSYKLHLQHFLMFQAHHLLCSISTFLVRAESNADSLSARTGDDNAPQMLTPSVNVLNRKLYCITVPRCLFTQLRLRIRRVSQGRLRDGNDCNHLPIHPCSQPVRVHLWYSMVTVF